MYKLKGKLLKKMIGDPTILVVQEDSSSIEMSSDAIEDVCMQTATLAVRDPPVNVDEVCQQTSTLSVNDDVNGSLASGTSSSSSLLSSNSSTDDSDDSLLTVSQHQPTGGQLYRYLEEVPIPLLYTRPPTCVLVFGHSFVRRLNEFLVTRFGAYHNFNLFYNYSDVYTFGVGGMTTSDALSRYIGVVAEFNPQVVFIQLGTNDLDSHRNSIRSIARNMAELCRRLQRAGVRRILIGQVLPRQSHGSRVHDFNTRVVSLNLELVRAVQSMNRVMLWQHRGFWFSQMNLMHDDGIHLNRRGNMRYYRSVRGGILFGLASIRRSPHV